MMAISAGPWRILRGEREQGGDCVSIIVDANGCTLADVFGDEDARAIAALPELRGRLLAITSFLKLLSAELTEARRRATGIEAEIRANEKALAEAGVKGGK